MQSDFSTWWSGLDAIAKFFWAISIPSTLILVLQIVLSFMGHDSDGDVDVDVDTDFDADGGGFSIFTVKNVLGFLTIFGWTGIVGHNSELGLWVTLGISFVAGTAMMLIMAGVFYSLTKLSHSGTMDVDQALFENGEVYLPVPRKRGGTGKVHIVVQGTLREMDAVTDDDEDLPQGTAATVTEIINGATLVVTNSNTITQTI